MSACGGRVFTNGDAPTRPEHAAQSLLRERFFDRADELWCERFDGGSEPRSHVAVGTDYELRKVPANLASAVRCRR
jgi:hypothetical protein